jgi:peptidoglycan/xylan/chitin deacetylase (PgdA/CDA1 family)
VAILSYHKIGPSPGEWESWYYVPEPVLAEHLEVLLGEGWAPLRAAELLAGLQQPQALPPRSFLITFDDAYQLLARGGLAPLLNRGLPGVVFAPTGYVGALNEFDRDIEPEEPICSWDDLRALHAAGVEIQSHSVTHRAFSDLPPAELAAELRESKVAIEGEIGATVQLLAFPYGDAGIDPAATGAQLEATGYAAAFGYAGGVARVGVDPVYLLPRLAMGPDTDLRAELRAVSGPSR